MARALLRWVLVIGLILFLPYLAYLDYQVTTRFEGKRWSLPAQVYARPLEVFPGLELDPDGLERELTMLGYRRVADPGKTGSYARGKQRIVLHSRAFRFWDGAEASRRAQIDFRDGRVRTVQTVAGEDLGILRLDPVNIGGIYPAAGEDRILVRLEQVPKPLIDALIETEDRGFRSHFGVDPRGIARALWANIRAGGVVQGGSTLTQQLVKNFFLSSERTLQRKVNEALMALLLEFHYDKDEILEAYLNEVYLGQAGRRAIHGFGQASWFYFRRPLAELELEHMALLVGLVKGPSYYNPRRNPDRARERRDLVLGIMGEQGSVTAAAVSGASQRPLGVTDKPPVGTTRYPAFMDLVRRQLRRDYREEDLTSEGLRIFTTLDPLAQDAAERSVAGRIRYLEKRFKLPTEQLQGAAVVTGTDSGEVLALVGGRDPAFSGFNRALDAVRPIGSLIKPAVYLTALSQPERYTLTTLVDDGPISHRVRQDGSVWEPKNADNKNHGDVTLYDALVHSYNTSTARLGLELGLDSVIDTVRGMGVDKPLNTYPSLLLGATDLSPLDVTRMYQTLAGGGFRTPIKAIRSVSDADDRPLQRYPLEVEQALDPAAVFLTKTAMVGVTREGTARYLRSMLGDDAWVAGKTGTTDDLRDSWFAGFSADRLGVVWLGMDDNSPSRLTGASGAMLVWADIMRRMGVRNLSLEPPPGVEWRWVDPNTGYFADEGCKGAFEMPFIQGSGPGRMAPCAGGESVQGPSDKSGGSIIRSVLDLLPGRWKIGPSTIPESD
ncbi:MAG: penicillin-binding protein 1B [Gammaproteobacteria bacterium]